MPGCGQAINQPTNQKPTSSQPARQPAIHPANKPTCQPAHGENRTIGFPLPPPQTKTNHTSAVSRFLRPNSRMLWLGQDQRHNDQRADRHDDDGAHHSYRQALPNKAAVIQTFRVNPLHKCLKIRNPPK